MTEKAITFFKQPPAADQIQDEPSTCTEAEPFALRVLDNSMEPEFRRGCVIIIDPTGRATDGSFVLVEGNSDVLFRQLVRKAGGWRLQPLNETYPPSDDIADDLSNVLGVIVQRAGVRRSYHKRYE
jgi:SOS-response transcriptional repressor LexA